MLWLILSFLTAVFSSISDIFKKKSLFSVDEYLASWSLRFTVLLISLPLLFFVGIPPISPSFGVALLISGSLKVIATVLYFRAIKIHDLSLAQPITNFTPAFLLITAPFILGEFPSGLGVIGILLIVFGSYVLNIKNEKKGLLAPIKAITHQSGPRYMLLVAFLASIFGLFDKVGVISSSPLFWVVSVNAFISIALLPIAYLRFQKTSIQKIPTRFLATMGVLSAFASILMMYAITLTLVVYAVSIKRFNSVITVITAHHFLNEKVTPPKIIGAIIMVSGVILIAFS